MRRVREALICGLLLSCIANGFSLAQRPAVSRNGGVAPRDREATSRDGDVTPRDREADAPGEEEALNQELWAYARKTPYAEALRHIARLQRTEPAKPSAETVLPNGWKMAPVGTQVELGRFPCEATVYAGQVVVLNAGYYVRGKELPEISVVNPETARVVRVVRLEGLFPSAQVGQDGDLYISGGISQKVFRLNRKFETVREYAINGDTAGPAAVNGYTAGLAAIDATHIAVVSLVASASPDDFQQGRYQQGRLAILNTATGEVERTVPTGYFPYAVRFLHGKLYVTLLGENTLQVYDAQLQPLKTVPVGRAPQDIGADEDRLYVVNTGSDSLSVVDTRTDAVVSTIDLHRNGSRFGTGPTSCAVDGDRLYVTQAGVNAVAVLDKKRGQPLGAIPTGWYPTKVIAQKQNLLVVSAKGIRARRPNVDGPQPVAERGGAQYVLTLLKGSLAIIPKAQIGSRLTHWTHQVAVGSPLYSPHTGFTLPIRHIFYIVRENRTYDQVLGDLGRGNGDPFLTLFGRDITPNGHRLADEFVTLDNYYADGEISVLGHSYTTSGYASPFLQWLGNAAYSGRYTGYPFGMVPAATSPAYLWDALDRQGLDYRIYGENYFLYTRAFAILKETFGAQGELTQKFTAQMMALASKVDRGNAFYTLANPYYGQASTPQEALRLLENADFVQALSTFLCGDASLASALREQPALRRRFADYLVHYPFNYRSWDLTTSDLDRALAWKADFESQLQQGHVASLHYIWLPNDHTGGTDPKYLPPDQLVAQNDAALGRIVETIAHSRIWNESLILITEDDAQNGPDHVDATRTVALAMGPYVRRRAVIHDRFDQLSLLRTIELLLGLPPLNSNDAAAAPMFSLFTEQANRSAYEPAPPSTHLSEADRQRYAQRK